MTKNEASKIVIAGFGACTPLGTDWTTTRDRLLAGEVGYSREELNDRTTCFGRIETVSDDDSRPRYANLAQRALDDLTTTVSLPDSGRLGLVATSSKGGLGKPVPETVTQSENPGIWSGTLPEQFSDVRRVATPNTACATGLSGLIHAARWLADERVDQAIVVASESCFHPLLLAGYQNLKVICDETGMRPFHPERSGFALSEGAGAMYLTTQHFQNKHDLPSKGKLLGWSETCDAHHMTNMKADGSEVSRAIDESLDRAGVTEEDIDLLHAHLTTTETNDKMESGVLEEWNTGTVLQGVKPSLGHTIGAAGLLEAIATLSSLNNNRPFPLPTTDPSNLPTEGLHPENATFSALKLGLSWNMGFGGHNAAAVLGSEE